MASLFCFEWLLLLPFPSLSTEKQENNGFCVKYHAKFATSPILISINSNTQTTHNQFYFAALDFARKNDVSCSTFTESLN